VPARAKPVEDGVAHLRGSTGRAPHVGTLWRLALRQNGRGSVSEHSVGEAGSHRDRCHGTFVHEVQNG